jgi:hypothetical protein
MVRPYHLSKKHKDAILREIRDRKYYRFYIDFLFKKGRVPTLEEFGKEFGFSRQRAGQILERLNKEGYLLKLRKYHSPYYPDLLSGYGDNKGRIINLDKKNYEQQQNNC